jgi:hypothetical protein
MITSDTFQSETPQRKKYIIGELKQIMKDNNLRSFGGLLKYLKNPESDKETNWSLYLQGSSKKSMSKLEKMYNKQPSESQKAKERLNDSGKFKLVDSGKYVYDGRKYGYVAGQKKEVIIEKTLYRGEFRITARTKDGRFASLVRGR